MNLISEVYQRVGFLTLCIDTEIDENSPNEEYEKFLRRNKKRIKREACKHYSICKNEAEKEAGNGAELHPDRLPLALPLKMMRIIRSLIDIVDEERRIAVQGYVFSAETKELRSGRTLLNF